MIRGNLDRYRAKIARDLTRPMVGLPKLDDTVTELRNALIDAALRRHAASISDDEATRRVASRDLYRASAALFDATGGRSP